MNATPRSTSRAQAFSSWADVQKRRRTDGKDPRAASRKGPFKPVESCGYGRGRTASTIAFVEPVIEALFGRLRADVLGVSSKRLKNARSDIRFVLGLLWRPAQVSGAVHAAAQRLWDMLVPSISSARCPGCCDSCRPRASIQQKWMRHIAAISRGPANGEPAKNQA